MPLLRLLERITLRLISTGQLHRLLCFYLRPINLVDYQESSPCGSRPYLGACFTLRCFQRLSDPDVATRLCRWRDNRFTSGPSDPVLSY